MDVLISNTNENHNLNPESSLSPMAIIILIILLAIILIIIIVKLTSKNTNNKDIILINADEIQINLQHYKTHKFSYEIYLEITNPNELYKYFNTSITKEEFDRKYAEQMEIIKHYFNKTYITKDDSIVKLISTIQKNIMQENIQKTYQYQPLMKLIINKSSNNNIDKDILILANMLILLENVCYNQDIPFIESK